MKPTEVVSTPARLRCAAMAIEGARWLIHPWNIDVANNVGATLNCDEADGVPVDAYGELLKAIERRMTTFGMACSDPDGCAFAMACAWEETRMICLYREHCAASEDHLGEDVADRALLLCGAGMWRAA